jgi:hypothetical protein
LASSWGNSWGGETGSWLTSWSGVASPTPAPSVTTPTPAGRSRKRRYFVEIDGQQFLVDSAEQARQLLDQARAIAERQSEERAERATKLLKRKKVVPQVRIAQPQIAVSPAIKAEVAPIIADIERLYRKAAIEAELRLLLMRQMAEEDDEDDILLLL